MQAQFAPETLRVRCCRIRDADRHGHVGKRPGPAVLHAADRAAARRRARADIATKNVLALNTGMFELYDDAAKIFQKNILSKHPVILGLFSGAGGRFILYRPGHGAARGAAGPDRLSTAEIRRTQHDGGEPGGGPLPRQSRRPVLAWLDARLSQPDAVGARRPRCDADAAGMARRPIAPCCRTTSRSWTTAWRRA